MSIKDIVNKIRKGVKAGVAAAKENNVLSDSKIVKLIAEFENSPERKLMLTGEKYYQVDNDIRNRKITKKMANGSVVEETFHANNKLAHAKYKNMVDEKIAYLLSKAPTYQVDEGDKQDVYIDCVKDILGKHFQYQLSGLGYEASNKGVGWLQVYIDEFGDLKTMVIPAEQCIPLWKDRAHMELNTMIRTYQTYAWDYDTKKTITNVEVWTADKVTYYRLDGKFLVADYEKNNDAGGPVAHYKVNDAWYTWGKVPFIPFKNNRIEIPDIKFVKSLVDGYDLSRSEAANYVEEVKNLIFVLKGYGGSSVAEFMQGLNEDRAVVVDSDEDSGVSVLNPQMDITALQGHYEQLKRDLIEDGQSVNKDLDKFGSAPSGVALKFMYSGLDLKCNLLETEFKMSFEMLLYFVDEYLKLIGKGDFTQRDMEIVFNRDMAVNETEIIQNCINSRGIISDETIIARHPFTTDVEEELAKLEEQKKNKEPKWDKTPLPLGGGTNAKEQ